MNRLTPELWGLSAFDGDTDLLETRELDFNLARRSAIVINKIIGMMFVHPDTTTGFDSALRIIQELDTDPDNIDTEFAGAINPDGVVLDSSRVFRQVTHTSFDTAAGAVLSPTTLMTKDWTNLPMEQRPISITALTHHCRAGGLISNEYQAELHIDYFIVELSLMEIGIINATRR